MDGGDGERDLGELSPAQQMCALFGVYYRGNYFTYI